MKRIGAVAAVGYVLTIFAANWLTDTLIGRSEGPSSYVSPTDGRRHW